jgi:carbamoylphosphate synthase large subunit
LSVAQKKTLYKDVRKGMNIREEVELLEAEFKDKDLENYIKRAQYQDFEPTVDDVVLAKHIFQQDDDELEEDEEELNERNSNPHEATRSKNEASSSY